VKFLELILKEMNCLIFVLASYMRTHYTIKGYSNKNKTMTVIPMNICRCVCVYIHNVTYTYTVPKP